MTAVSKISIRDGEVRDDLQSAEPEDTYYQSLPSLAELQRRNHRKWQAQNCEIIDCLESGYEDVKDREINGRPTLAPICRDRMILEESHEEQRDQGGS